MTGFLGSFLHQLDEKGRLALPAQFRRNAEGGEFVLIRSYETALFLYPAQAWSDVSQELHELWDKNPRSRHFVRNITSRAQQTVPDNQGRILIPAHLQREAQFEREVLIVGTLHKIELWNPQLFERATAEAETEFEQFARQIIT